MNILQKVIDVTDIFSKRDNNKLIFSIKLGANDSAMQGPNGSPVSTIDYVSNLKKITMFLMERYPKDRQYSTANMV